MIRSLLFFVFVSLLSSLSAQEYSYLYGDFEGKNLALDILLRVDQRNYNGKLKNYEQKLNANAGFWLNFKVERPQIVKLVYARNELEIFVEPGDTIYITIDPQNFKYNSKLKGTNGVKNDILKHFSKNNNSAQRRSELLQFKHGQLWYYSNIHIDSWMRSMEEQVFMEKMTSRKDQWSKYLLQQMEAHPKVFNKSFEDYMWSEINYDWAYFMLIYGTTYAQRHSLAPDYLSFLELISDSTGHMSSAYYRKFLIGKLNYYHEQKDFKGDYFSSMIELAKAHYNDEEQAYVISEMFVKMLKNKDQPDFIESYYKFINNNKYTAYSERLSRKFQSLIGLSVGSKAENISLITAEGDLINLDDFKGKPVLLDFWASWCKPCLQKLPEFQRIEAEFGDSLHVVLVNLDASHEKYLSALETYSPPGINLFTSPDDQMMTLEKLGIKFLPGIIFLDANGRFVVTADQFDLLDWSTYWKSL